MRAVLIAAWLVASGAAWGQTPDPTPITGAVTYPDGGCWASPAKGDGPGSDCPDYTHDRPTGSYLCKTGNDPACLTSAMGSVVQVNAIVIGSSPHQVTIHIDTGRVDYTGTPDKAARAFWEAVKTLMPLYVECEAPDAH